MADVLADLEAKLNEAKAALAPLVAAEAAALADVASKTSARIAQDVQIAAIAAAHVAMKARLLGSEAVAAVEGEASKVGSAVWGWVKPVIGHGWSFLAGGGVLAGLKAAGLLAWLGL